MDGFAGSLGERLRAARSGGRDGTAREGRGEPDSGRQPALLSWGRGPGTRTCGRAGSRRGQRRAAGSASGSWSRGDAELSAQRHPLCGGRGGKRVGREGEREREGGDASAKSGQLQTICCESSGCTCLLCSFLAVGLLFPGVTYLGLSGSFCLMPF